MLGLMNNIIINNNIIICSSQSKLQCLSQSMYLLSNRYTTQLISFASPFILQQQQESNPRLPLDYTANYDYLILLFLTISSWYLIRYYLSIEQQGIEPYTVATCTSSNYSNLIPQQPCTSSLQYDSVQLCHTLYTAQTPHTWTIHHTSLGLDLHQHSLAQGLPITIIYIKCYYMLSASMAYDI